MARISPVVFAQQARAFLAAAQREITVAGMLVSMPAYFLVGRAIELGLKSFMLLEGKTEADLRRISHDLSAALDAAIALGFTTDVPVSAEADAAVRWISPYYDTKDLEYPTQGYKSYPEIRYLVEFADHMLNRLQPRLRAWRP